MQKLPFLEQESVKYFKLYSFSKKKKKIETKSNTEKKNLTIKNTFQ